jgi:hypothetical protein
MPMSKTRYTAAIIGLGCLVIAWMVVSIYGWAEQKEEMKKKVKVRGITYGSMKGKRMPLNGVSVSVWRDTVRLDMKTTEGGGKYEIEVEQGSPLTIVCECKGYAQWVVCDQYGENGEITHFPILYPVADTTAMFGAGYSAAVAEQIKLLTVARKPVGE